MSCDKVFLWLFDMMRSSTNVLGHASCAVIVEKMLSEEIAVESVLKDA